MDARAMSSRGGGTWRNLFVMILASSVVILGYRYSKLLAKYEAQGALLLEKDYEVREIQEDVGTKQRHLIESEDALKQCQAQKEKDNSDKNTIIEDIKKKHKEVENNANQLTKAKADLQLEVDNCKKDKERQVSALTKERDTARNEKQTLSEGNESLKTQLENVRKQLEEAKVQQPQQQQPQQQQQQPAQQQPAV